MQRQARSPENYKRIRECVCVRAAWPLMPKYKKGSGHAQKKKRSRARAMDATPTASITDGSLQSAKSRRKAPTTKKYVVIGDQWVEQPETTGTRAGSSFSAAAADFQREQSAAKRRSKAAEAAMAAVAVVQPARSQSLSERKVKSGERSPSSRARRALRECTRAKASSRRLALAAECRAARHGGRGRDRSYRGKSLGARGAQQSRADSQVSH